MLNLLRVCAIALSVGVSEGSPQVVKLIAVTNMTKKLHLNAQFTTLQMVHCLFDIWQQVGVAKLALCNNRGVNVIRSENKRSAALRNVLPDNV